MCKIHSATYILILLNNAAIEKKYIWSTKALGEDRRRTEKLWAMN